MVDSTIEPRQRGAIERALAWLHRAEMWVLTLLVLVLVVLAGAQIFLRNFFGGGLVWADPFLRTLVVWTAILGALAAVRDDKHIAIDVVQRFLSAPMQRASRVVTLLFAACICAAMAWHSANMVAIDFGTTTNPGGNGVPAWVLESILPFGFALMALRFILHAFAPAQPREPELIHDPGAIDAYQRHPNSVSTNATDAKGRGT